MIANFEIKNFKCFEWQSFALRGLNILAGMNGAGKSSVIQCLLLLRQSFEQGVLRDVGLSLNGEYLNVGSAKDARYERASDDELALSIELDSGKSARWTFGVAGHGLDGPASDSEGDVLHNLNSTVAEEVFRSSLFMDDFEYLEAERIGPRTSFPTSDYLVRRRKRLGNRGEYATHFLSCFGRSIKVNQRLSHGGATSLDLLDQVEAWIGEVSPGARLHFSPYEGMDAINLQFSFAFASETTSKFRATNVGFGMTYALPVVVAILSARAGSLLIIENPEAHVHPKGQVIIGRLLARAASCGVQCIVETHSDHIINGIRIAIHSGECRADAVAMFYFRRELSGEICSTVIQEVGIHANGRLTARPVGFFDEFSHSLDQLLGVPTPYGSAIDSQ